MIIEALVQYIRDCGFEVFVMPGVLLIRKGDYGYDWAISQQDLAYRHAELLFNEADDILNYLEKAALS
jgi:hypothetical protein